MVAGPRLDSRERLSGRSREIAAPARRAALRWALPLAVAACAVAVAVPGALGHALYGDEVASARIVSESGLTGVLGHVRRTESTPPGWYVLAWSVRRADAAITEGHPFGNVTSLRLLSVLFAAAASVLTAIWALRLLGDRLAAALAGSLLALGSLPVEYAEQLRAYALVVLIAVAFGLLLTEAALRPRRRWFFGVAAAAWLGTMTHYFFFFVVAAGAVWLWTVRPRPRGTVRASLAIGFGMLAFLPWLPTLLAQEHHGRYRWIGPFDPVQVVTLPGSLFFGPDGLFYGLARLAVTFALVAGAVALWWRRSEGTAVVALGLLPILGAGVVWAAGQPIFDARNLLPVAPFLAILIAAGITALPRRPMQVAALAGIVATVAGAAYAQATLGRVAYDSVAQALTGLGWNDGEPLVVDYPTAAANRRGVGIQITSAMSWYLPGRPELVWAARRRGCQTRFAIVQVRDPRSWLARYGDRVAATRVFTYYDHPILGRPRGRIVVARFRTPTRVTGAFFHALGQNVACRRAAGM